MNKTTTSSKLAQVSLPLSPLQQEDMLSPKKLIKMVQKWHKFAALGRKRRIMSAASTNGSSSDACSSSIASRGHVFVYTADCKRFMVPLRFLSSSIFRELFKMSEEEFGLPSDGPIRLPCGAACMEYIISLLMKQAPEDAERNVLAAIRSSSCLTDLVSEGLSQQQQFIIYGF